MIPRFIVKTDPDELEQLQKELDGIYDIFDTVDKQYADLRRGRPQTLDKIQMLL